MDETTVVIKHYLSVFVFMAGNNGLLFNKINIFMRNSLLHGFTRSSTNQGQLSKKITQSLKMVYFIIYDGTTQCFVIRICKLDFGLNIFEIIL